MYDLSMGYVSTGTKFRWDVLFIALLIPSLNCDQSSLADLLIFIGDVITSLISLKSLFKSLTSLVVHEYFPMFLFVQLWFCR